MKIRILALVLALVVPADIFAQTITYQQTTTTAVSTGSGVYPTVKLRDGKVVIYGQAAYQTYDPVTNTATTTGPFADFPTNAAAILGQDGQVWMTGGILGGATSKQVLRGNVPIAPMNVARANHAMVGLPDGRMLVIGGDAAGVATASIEIGSVSSQTFTPFGSLSVARTRVTATMDRFGRIIVIGGMSAPNIASNVIEIIDPATGTVTVAPSLTKARWDHRVAVLQDGRLLVMGGAGSSQSSTSVEIVTPTPTSLTVSAALFPLAVTGRIQHTATTLPDGRVLVTGGIAQPELYSLSSATSLFPLTSAPVRSGHSANLLPDGSVLITGGTSTTEQAELIAIGDARTAFSVISSTSFSRAADSAIAVNSDGRIVLLSSAIPDIYNPTAGTTATLTNSDPVNPLTVSQLSTAVSLGANKILVVGASPSAPYTPTNEIVTIGTSTFTSTDVTGARDARSRATAALLPDGRVLVAGGFRNTVPITPVTSVEVLNPTTRTWADVATYGVAGYGASITVTPEGRVFVIGGLAGEIASNTVLEFHPATNTLTQVATLRVGRYAHSATAIGNQWIVVAGGIGEEGTQGYTGSIELVNVTTGTSSTLPGTLLQPRGFHSAMLQGEGSLLIAGGTTGVATLSSVEQYDLLTNSSQLVSPMTQARMRPLMTFNGGTLLAGGAPASSTALVEKANGVSTGWQVTATLQTQTTNLAFAAQNASDNATRLQSWFYELHTSANVREHLQTVAPLSVERPNSFGTVLTDGRAVVVGGGTGNTQRGVEIFDPATGAWTVRSLAMNSSRASGTATTLDSGRVLIHSANSAEVFDPAATQAPFSTIALGSTNSRAAGATLKLPDGRVLMSTGSSALNNDLYYPRINRLIPAGTMSVARSQHGHLFAGPNGVLVIGGSATSAQVERWIDRGGEITATLSQARGTGLVTSWSLTGLTPGTVIGNGTVLYVNGLSSSVTINVAVTANAAGTATVTTNAATLPVVIPAGTAVSIVNDMTAVASTSIQVGATVFPSITGLMPGFKLVAGERLSTTAAIFTVTSTVTADVNGTAVNVPIEPASASVSAGVGLSFVWTQPAGTLLFPRSNAAATSLPDGRIFVTGGTGVLDSGTTTSLHSSEIFDPVSGTSSLVASRPTYPTSGQNAVPLLDGRIVITGQDVDLFDPSTGENKLSAVSTNVLSARGFHFTGRLPDGRVLIAGGNSAAVEIYSDGTSYDDLTTQVANLAATIASLETEVGVLQGLLPGALATLQDQVTAVQAQLAAANAQVASLQGQLAAANSANTTLQGEKTALINQVNGLQTQINQQNTQIANLQAQLAIAANDIALRDQAISNHVATIATRDLTIASLNTASAGLSQQVSDLNNLNSTLAGENLSLTQQLAAANQTIADRNATIAAHVSTIAQLNANNAALAQQLANEVAAKNALQAQLTAVQADLVAAGQTIAARDATIAVLNTEKDALASSLNDANAANATLTGQVASLQADLVAANQTIAQRDATITSHVATIAQLNSDKSALTQQLSDTIAEKNQLQTQLTAAQADLAAANQTIAAHVATIAQLNTDNAGLTQQLATEVAAKQALQTQLAEVQAELGAANQVISARDAAIAGLTQEKNALTVSLNDANAANATLQADLATATQTISQRDGTIAAHVATIAQLASDKSALTQQLNDAIAGNTQLQAQLASAQADLAAAGQTIALREATIAQQQTTITTLTGDKAALQASLDAATATVSSLTAQVGALTTENTALEGQVSALTTQLNAAATTIATLTTQVTTLTGEKTALQGQLTTLSAQLTDSQAQLASAQSGLATANQTIAARDTTIAQQQSTIATLGADNTALQASLNTANASIATLTSEKAAIQALLNTANAKVTTLTSEKAALQTQVNTLTSDKAALQAQLATANQNVTTLTAQKNTLQVQVVALQAQVAQLQQQQGELNLIRQFVDRVEEALTIMRRVGFVIPGATPADQLENLVDAIGEMPKGARLQLIKELIDERGHWRWNTRDDKGKGRK